MAATSPSHSPSSSLLEVSPAPVESAGGAPSLVLVADEMRRVEAALAARMESPIGRIPEVGAHLLQAGGKRLRPLLAVLAARATDVPMELAVAVGVAGELIHTATLYHDDVVDDGRVRRGRPAARMVYGNGIVVLVGDFCLARALETVALTGSVGAVQSLAATVTEMAEGEVAQLERAGNPEATVDDYFRVIDRKTASLIAWCARVAGGVGSKFDGALDRYGRAVGRAFQIADDVLDCAADETTAGKSVGRDIQEGKLTLPVLYACEADARLRALVREKVGETAVSPGDAATILTATRAAGGVERARAKARELTIMARDELNALRPSPFRDALAELATHSADRKF
ncbi:MAG: polyprenyl synthetase family protein [Polyangia bacterium]